MTVMERLEKAKIVPVVVLDSAEAAPDTARAILAGGIDVMEITFRTGAAPQAIQAVREQCPEMLVGAGTVLTVAQAALAVQMGAAFIVSPGYDADVVSWCLKNEIAVIPGCVTPTEITAALRNGLHVVKFFPANVYGGLSAMKNLSAPFGSVKFLPTGGVNTQNIREYLHEPFILGVGGSWVCPKDYISSGDYEKITWLCAEARRAAEGETEEGLRWAR